MPTANPRAICAEMLLRWESGRLFADDILHEALRENPLPPLDRAFLTEIFYGVLRHLSSLDFVIRKLREGSIDRATRQLLRLGFYQIFRMRTAEHAAVNETVNLAGRARGLVNALLRRSLREKSEIERAIEQAPASIRLSHPDFLVSRWEKNFGANSAMELCDWNNQPAEIFVRVNILKVTPGELQRTLPDAQPHLHPLVFKTPRVPLMWIVNGLCYVQDPSTLIACELLAPRPGEQVLDACAAPGGKTTYLAQLMQNEGRIIACDTSPQRLARIRENVARLGARNVKIIQHDWLSKKPPFEKTSFDKILLDAPCSNTGVIRRRIDVKWRLTDEDFQKMPQKQLAILKAVIPLLKIGGALVYSSCSIEPEENEELIQRIEKEIPQLCFIESRQSLPFRDKMDGAFAAKFVLN